MIERGKNNPAIFMWSLGNEVSEANGDAHSLKTIKRLLGRVKEVDDSRFVTMGMDQFRFGDGSGGHEYKLTIVFVSNVTLSLSVSDFNCFPSVVTYLITTLPCLEAVVVPASSFVIFKL